MPPSPSEIPASGDETVQEILDLARDGVTADLLGCLVDRDRMALFRYEADQTRAAFRLGSVPLLREALLAMAVGLAATVNVDDRDVMVGLAVPYFVAEQLGQSAEELFSEIAALLPAGWLPDLLREFGARTDITLESFGWLLVQTPDGPDFTPAPPPWARHRDRKPS